MEETSPTSVKSLVSQDSFQELQERATKDALSGLLNRITVEQYVQKRLAALGDGEMCALLIVDLDDFKRVNDTLGHLAGDHAGAPDGADALGAVPGQGRTGQAGRRRVHRLFVRRRYGGLGTDEGAGDLPGAAADPGNAPGITITASVGICIASGRNLNFDHLYQAADLALYKAKKNGKHGFYINTAREPGKAAFCS